jgi:hypothetical protein
MGTFLLWCYKFTLVYYSEIIFEYLSDYEGRYAFWHSNILFRKEFCEVILVTQQKSRILSSPRLPEQKSCDFYLWEMC